MIRRLDGDADTYVLIHDSGALVGARARCADGRVRTLLRLRPSGSARARAGPAGGRTQVIGDLYLDGTVFRFHGRGRRAALVGDRPDPRRRRRVRAGDLAPPELTDHPVPPDIGVHGPWCCGPDATCSESMLRWGVGRLALRRTDPSATSGPHPVGDRWRDPDP